MKATKITYKKLFALGNFENEQIGIELELESGETADRVLEEAKKFVNGLSPANKRKAEYDTAVQLLSEKDAYNYRRVMEAQKIVADYEAILIEETNLPF